MLIRLPSLDEQSKVASMSMTELESTIDKTHSSPCMWAAWEYASRLAADKGSDRCKAGIEFLMARSEVKEPETQVALVSLALMASRGSPWESEVRQKIALLHDDEIKISVNGSVRDDFLQLAIKDYVSGHELRKIDPASLPPWTDPSEKTAKPKGAAGRLVDDLPHTLLGISEDIGRSIKEGVKTGEFPAEALRTETFVSLQNALTSLLAGKPVLSELFSETMDYTPASLAYYERLYKAVQKELAEYGIKTDVKEVGGNAQEGFASGFRLRPLQTQEQMTAALEAYYQKAGPANAQENAKTEGPSVYAMFFEGFYKRRREESISIGFETTRRNVDALANGIFQQLQMGKTPESIKNVIRAELITLKRPQKEIDEFLKLVDWVKEDSEKRMDVTQSNASVAWRMFERADFTKGERGGALGFNAYDGNTFEIQREALGGYAGKGKNDPAPDFALAVSLKKSALRDFTPSKKLYVSSIVSHPSEDQGFNKENGFTPQYTNEALEDFATLTNMPGLFEHANETRLALSKWNGFTGVDRWCSNTLDEKCSLETLLIKDDVRWPELNQIYQDNKGMLANLMWSESPSEINKLFSDGYRFAQDLSKQRYLSTLMAKTQATHPDYSIIKDARDRASGWMLGDLLNTFAQNRSRVALLDALMQETLIGGIDNRRTFENMEGAGAMTSTAVLVFGNILNVALPRYEDEEFKFDMKLVYNPTFTLKNTELDMVLYAMYGITLNAAKRISILRGDSPVCLDLKAGLMVGITDYDFNIEFNERDKVSARILEEATFDTPSRAGGVVTLGYLRAAFEQRAKLGSLDIANSLKIYPITPGLMLDLAKTFGASSQTIDGLKERAPQTGQYVPTTVLDTQVALPLTERLSLGLLSSTNLNALTPTTLAGFLEYRLHGSNHRVNGPYQTESGTVRFTAGYEGPFGLTTRYWEAYLKLPNLMAVGVRYQNGGLNQPLVNLTFRMALETPGSGWTPELPEDIPFTTPGQKISSPLEPVVGDQNVPGPSAMKKAEAEPALEAIRITKIAPIGAGGKSFARAGPVEMMPPVLQPRPEKKKIKNPAGGMTDEQEERIETIKKSDREIQLAVYLDKSGSVKPYAKQVEKIVGDLRGRFSDRENVQMVCNDMWGDNGSPKDPDHYDLLFNHLTENLKPGVRIGDVLVIGDGGVDGVDCVSSEDADKFIKAAKATDTQLSVFFIDNKTEARNEIAAYRRSIEIFGKTLKTLGKNESAIIRGYDSNKDHNTEVSNGLYGREDIKQQIQWCGERIRSIQDREQILRKMCEETGGRFVVIPAESISNKKKQDAARKVAVDRLLDILEQPSSTPAQQNTPAEKSPLTENARQMHEGVRALFSFENEARQLDAKTLNTMTGGYLDFIDNMDKALVETGYQTPPDQNALAKLMGATSGTVRKIYTVEESVVLFMDGIRNNTMDCDVECRIIGHALIGMGARAFVIALPEHAILRAQSADGKSVYYDPYEPEGKRICMDEKTIFNRYPIRYGEQELEGIGGNDYNSRAQAKMSNNQYAAAKLDYSEAIKRSPKDADAFSNRGVAEMFLEQTDEALADCNLAIKLNPRFSAFYSNRGLVKAATGHQNEAIVDFDEALKLNPNNPSAILGRAMAMRELKEQREGKPASSE